MSELMIAKIPFTYNRQNLERGELVELKGTPRDDQLRGLNYFVTYDKNEHSRSMCDNCGKIFASDGFRISHKKKPGGCLAPSPEITKAETADLLGVDPLKVKVEE